MTARTKAQLLVLAKQALDIDSRNSHGNIEMVRFLAPLLKQQGFAVQYQRARLNGVPQINLIAHIGPSRGRALVLNTHLDTVETHPEEWTRTGGDPFRATVHRGRLYGLGSADTKLALACQLSALAGMDLSHLKRPLVITGTYGEELGLVGVMKLVKQWQIRRPYVLNSEPTELLVCNENFGFRIYHIKGTSGRSVRKRGPVYHLRFSGEAAHSASPTHGRNAIVSAFSWLKAHGTHCNLVSIEGGLAPNIVAPRCDVHVLSPKHPPRGLRSFHGERVATKKANVSIVSRSLEDFLVTFPEYLWSDHSLGELANLGTIHFDAGRLDIIFSYRFSRRVDPHVRLLQWREFLRGYSALHPGTLCLAIKKDNPAFHQASAGRLVKGVRGVLKTMGRSTRLVKKFGCTEASIFAQVGAEALTIGPGVAYGNAHQPNESVAIKQLEAAVEFYRKAIKKICF